MKMTVSQEPFTYSGLKLDDSIDGHTLISPLLTSFLFGGDNCRMNLGIFRKHLSQTLVIIGSNLVDKLTLLNVGASNNYTHVDDVISVQGL